MYKINPGKMHPQSLSMMQLKRLKVEFQHLDSKYFLGPYFICHKLPVWPWHVWHVYLLQDQIIRLERFQCITYNFSERFICKTYIYSYYASIGTNTVIVTVRRTDSYD